MNTWEIAILKIISGRGKASLKELYEKINQHIELNENHFVEKYGVPTYHHQIRAHISDLQDKGHVKNVKRGIYAITEEGITRIKFSN